MTATWRLTRRVLLVLVICALPEPVTVSAQTSLRFAVIGDYGVAGQTAFDVAALVHSWDPDFVITTGDNNYPSGEAATIDANVGQSYHEFIAPYRGAYGAGAAVNRFFPALGNHDWDTAGAQPYLDFFRLPGNGRYYDVVRGSVHLFALDSDPREPDGTTATSVQGQWLQAALARSTARWKIVYMHHPPYSSGQHGSTSWMQWPFAAWGADAVLAGHDHLYERLAREMPYFVNGVGGNPSLYTFQTVEVGSQVRFTGEFGAMLVTATDTRMTFRFIVRDGTLVDSLTLPPQFPLTVNLAGAGKGAVVSSPAGIDCPTSCAVSLPTDSSVMLTATPAAGSLFVGWTGSCTGTGPCTVTMDTARSVTAMFAPAVTLGVVRSGPGSGTVTGPTIACGSSCAATFAAGTSVTLTATAAAGSFFVGWTGGGCAGTGTCTLTLTSSTTVTATFGLGALSLTVGKLGSGAGTVTSVPEGITCASTCPSASASYAGGTTVTLTAVAAADSVFAGWSGGGCGAGPTCTVIVDVDTTLLALFAAQTSLRFDLTVALRGSGAGTVTSTPAGIQCQTTCSTSYGKGTAVTLVATAEPGARFAGWGGACGGGGASCAVILNAGTSVTATFSAIFTEETLAARTTIVRAVHVTELRAAIDTLRSRMGLSGFPWAGLPVPRLVVAQAHVAELRTALRRVYEVVAHAPPSYTDDVIVPGLTPIRALHVDELRRAVRALE